jgi:hypothetical protein
MKDVFIMGTITVRSKTRNAGSLAIRNEELKKNDVGGSRHKSAAQEILGWLVFEKNDEP